MRRCPASRENDADRRASKTASADYYPAIARPAATKHDGADTRVLAFARTYGLSLGSGLHTCIQGRLKTSKCSQFAI